MLLDAITCRIGFLKFMIWEKWCVIAVKVTMENGQKIGPTGEQSSAFHEHRMTLYGSTSPWKCHAESTTSEKHGT